MQVRPLPLHLQNLNIRATLLPYHCVMTSAAASAAAGKDVFWYTKAGDAGGVSNDELEAVKQQERDMMAEVRLRHEQRGAASATDTLSGLLLCFVAGDSSKGQLSCTLASASAALTFLGHALAQLPTSSVAIDLLLVLLWRGASSTAL